jgi:hypothetical protein
MILEGKIQVLGEKPFPVPLCPTQIPHVDWPGIEPGPPSLDAGVNPHEISG